MLPSPDEGPGAQEWLENGKNSISKLLGWTPTLCSASLKPHRALCSSNIWGRNVPGAALGKGDDFWERRLEALAPTNLGAHKASITDQ